MSVAHPPIREVELTNGGTVKLRPWSMAQRAELRPQISSMLDELAVLESGPGTLSGASMAKLFVKFEDKITQIVRDSIPIGELSEELWDAMAWEDIPTLAQAIWETNVARADGGGILGKLGAGLGGMLVNLLQAGVAETEAGNGKSASPIPTDPSKTSSRPEASATSLTDGAPTPSA